MNILICDDMQDDAEKLVKAVKQADDSKVNCIHFDNGEEALSYLQTGAKIDVCFLDIIMPQMKGTELAFNIRKMNADMAIVFLTASNEYAAEAFDVGAFHYLLKPPDVNKVKNILKNIDEARKSADTAGIQISTRNINRFLLFKEISFIEVIQNKVYFRLLDGNEIAVYFTLTEIMPQLKADGRFAQCHRSYVVNMDAILQICSSEIFLRCGRKAPISKNYKGFCDFYLKRAMGSDMC